MKEKNELRVKRLATIKVTIQLIRSDLFCMIALKIKFVLARICLAVEFHYLHWRYNKKVKGHWINMQNNYMEVMFEEDIKLIKALGWQTVFLSFSWNIIKVNED